MNRYVAGLLSQNNATHVLLIRTYLNYLGDLFLEIVRLCAKWEMVTQWCQTISEIEFQFLQFLNFTLY
jgi:hypothetical protein